MQTHCAYDQSLSDDDVETHFEWKGYFGKHSGVIDGIVKMVGSGGRYTAHIAGVSTGFIVGTIVRRLSRRPVNLSSDELAKQILKTHKSSFPEFSNFVLSLNDFNGILNEESAIVLVHGTLSSCAAAFQSLAKTSFASPVLAFEHDTFANITDNEKELAALVKKHLGRTKRILFVGHSRGGLVARAAAHRLKLQGVYDGSLDVWTFGTPHLGTPLVTSASNFLQLLCNLGSTVAGGARFFDAGLAAWSYFLPMMKSLPRGIEQMKPDCDFLEKLTPVGANDNFVTAYAGKFDISRPSVGFGISFRNSFGGTAFDDRPNDLVVPTASAFGVGMHTQFVEDCAHSEYFNKSAIQTSIWKW
jgi:pimeloyl-ACP methyl ester carboxylesterase